MTALREWFEENLSDYASDIANHGADAGYPHMTYTNECVELYTRFEEEIWAMLRDEVENSGYKSVPALIADFGRVDMSDDPHSFKNLLWWFACETIAREVS